MDSPYARPTLQATLHKRVDPGTEVALWVDRLGYVLEGGFAEEAEAEETRELLVLWAALKRVRPELIQEVEGHEVVREVDEWVQREGSRLVSATRPPEGQAAADEARAWLEAVATFDESYMQMPLDPKEEVEQACDLLQELDEAELLGYALRQWGEPEPTFHSALQRCLEWVKNRSDLFLGAGPWVQAIGMALRSDLRTTDPLLAHTAEKFLSLLDAFGQAETDLALDGLMPMSAEELAALPRLHLPSPHPAWLPPVYHPPLAAAEQIDLGALDIHWRGKWRSPDGRYTARLIVPRKPEGGEEHSLTLALYDERGEPAEHLSDGTITLAGVTAVLHHGRASFTLKELRKTAGEPDLAVRGEQWTRQIP